MEERENNCGAGADGGHGGERSHLIALAIRTQISIRDFADTIRAYPTYTEIVKRAFVRHLGTKE